MRQAMKLLVAAAAALTVTGCATALRTGQTKLDYYLDNVPELDEAEVTTFTGRQARVIGRFEELAGVRNPRMPADWQQVVRAGVHYVDIRCERFMDALFWFNRVRETSSRQIHYGSAAATAALTILEASKDLIGLTPLAFTLADETINNVGKGLLYDLNPSVVRVLVEKQQVQYLDQIQSAQFTNRMSALTAIQGYAALCLPASIETEVNRAIDAAEYKPVDILRKPAPKPAAGEDAGEDETNGQTEAAPLVEDPVPAPANVDPYIRVELKEPE